MAWRDMDKAWRAELPANDKLVLLAYCDRADKETGTMYGGINYIARRCGLSRSTVQRIRARLIEGGYLVVLEERRGYVPLILVQPLGEPRTADIVDMDAWRRELEG